MKQEKKERHHRWWPVITTAHTQASRRPLTAAPRAEFWSRRSELGPGMRVEAGETDIDIAKNRAPGCSAFDKNTLQILSKPMNSDINLVTSIDFLWFM